MRTETFWRLGVRAGQIILGAAVSLQGIAQTPAHDETAFFFTFENDLFFGTDKYYTDGPFGALTVGTDF